jgi:hypothetical protein
MAATAVEASKPTKPRWYVPTPAKFLFAVLVMQGVLFLSAHYRWFSFNERRGWTVLIAVAVTVSALLLLAGLVVVSRFFRLLRRVTQFSMATLLLMVPVMALPCGWLAREMEYVRETRATVKALDPVMAMSSYDFQSPQGLAPHFMGARGSEWLLSVFGRDFFSNLERVSLVEPSPQQMRALAGLKQLKTVRLTGQRPYRPELKYLPELPELQDLNLYISGTTDGDLQHLRGCTKLRGLALHAVGITDDGLRFIKDLNRLETLELDTRITDEGLAHLAGLKNLKELDLSYTQVKGDGLGYLKECKHLSQLSLKYTPVTDAGLEQLQNFPKLTWLQLEDTQISDEGLRKLTSLTQLSYLTLHNTNVTDDGVKEFRKALPKCNIQRW